MSEVKYWQISTELMDQLFTPLEEPKGTLDTLAMAASLAVGEGYTKEDFLASADAYYNLAKDLPDGKEEE